MASGKESVPAEALPHYRREGVVFLHVPICVFHVENGAVVFRVSDHACPLKREVVVIAPSTAVSVVENPSTSTTLISPTAVAAVLVTRWAG